MKRKLALVIGNSEYEDRHLAELVTPSADANALAEVLRDPEIGGFDDVTALVNQSAATIRRAVSSFFAERRREDLLLLYFSGHGIRDDRGRLFLAVKDTEHNLLGGTAIPADFITDEMDNSRSRRQVLILDCCHSGAFSRGMKGIPGSSVGTAVAFEGTGSGRVVLTATDSTQYAWEGDQVIGQAENSVFTYYLVQGLKSGKADTDSDGRITLDELYNYVYEKVISETPKQTPGKWSYGQQGEMVIARNPRPIEKPAELPHDLQQSIDDLRPWVREGSVRELERLLRSDHPGLALAAHEALNHLLDDDSRRVVTAAKKALAAHEERQSTTEEVKTAERIDKKILDELPRWAIWVGLLLLGGLVVGFIAIRQKNPGVGISPTATQSIVVISSPTLALTSAAHSIQPTSSPPVIIKLTNTPPSPVSTDEPNEATVQPAWLDRLIAFVSDRDGNRNIYLMNTDGSELDRLTNDIDENNPAWSPDGTRIAFESKRDGNWEIYVMNADGSEQTRLTDNPEPDRIPAWSPDGTRIAFASNRDDNSEIYLMNTDGSGLTRLTNNSEVDFHPTWSPDGTRIAFESVRDGNRDIYVMNADGSAQTRLTDNPARDWYPAWSHDGTRIAFSSERDGNWEIYVMNADGSRLTRLTNNSANDWFTNWSPDGTRIAFTSERDGNSEIYLMNADGSEQTRLTNNPAFDSHPAWQPNP